MWLAPTCTVGIAKKEIIWYPLFGQLYVLANHLRIDRSNPAAAIHSMKQVARAVVKNNLSLILFPEGTRSKNGRLLPFKKGFVHAALQTGLPVVPIVVTGTHLAWRNNSLRVRPVPLTVKVLPPIGTAGWEEARVDEHVEVVAVRLQPPRRAEAAGCSGRPEERLICHRPDEDSCKQC
ncbi:unnamed protein product [Miscanthus lutarioriparius]|uniref:Phospholipid/glycerol acyltransferase domain-containing protein n=1 Tax=Miscanthus lutarioriparius TaxID=422564 RepID=A0A811QSX0_9POAL|nr:unnamed protein product [Miscanthus lutarioriparius]